MKKSGFQTAFHIYTIFLLALTGTLAAAAGLFFLLITVRGPEGAIVRSDWPKTFTENFKEQIIFIDHNPRITLAGMDELQEHGAGIQILDGSGQEVFSFQKPEQAAVLYSISALLRLQETGHDENTGFTSFIGEFSHGGDACTYILHFPLNIRTVTMYLSGVNFTGGKTVFLPVLAVLLALILFSGIVYGFWTVRTMNTVTAAICDISGRNYLPLREQGAFSSIYSSLNTLNEEILAGDRLRKQMENRQEEWIANITHDLKTPLSPIKGYAEIMSDSGTGSTEKYQEYARIISKNASCMESLINDLKLTYQLKNGMIPFQPEKQNVVRFLRETVIDLLNDPEYGQRCIHFESGAENIPYDFDTRLFRRAFQNLIVNAFTHGDSGTEVFLTITSDGELLAITVSDNGNGMSEEEAAHLFERYYRGGGTDQRPEGTGLGLAIVSEIILLHGGTIGVSSIPGRGTQFLLQFKVLHDV